MRSARGTRALATGGGADVCCDIGRYVCSPSEATDANGVAQLAVAVAVAVDVGGRLPRSVGSYVLRVRRQCGVPGPECLPAVIA